jgi:anaerobic ribonucleoside-triphosphate reductase activating protein
MVFPPTGAPGRTSSRTATAGCTTSPPKDGGEAVSVEDLARRILDGPRVEGVTFSGGEPVRTGTRCSTRRTSWWTALFSRPAPAGLAGSSNQRLHFLTPRYAHLRVELQADPRPIAVRLGADGEILVNGVVSPGALEAMLDGLACVEPPSRASR